MLLEKLCHPTKTKDDEPFFLIRYVSQDVYVIVQTQNEMVDGLTNTCIDDIINMHICH